MNDMRSIGKSTLKPAQFIVGVCTLAILSTLVLGSADDAAAESELFVEFSGRVGVEAESFGTRWTPPGVNSNNKSSSVILEPQIYIENDAGSSFNFSALYRHDGNNPKRRVADIREAYFLTFGEFEESEWEVRAGIDKVFWGVTESKNIVNIINQLDLQEDPFEKERLGQPLVQFTWVVGAGIAEFFVLPYHRKRTILELDGRPTTPLAVDNSEPVYESKEKEKHIDFAARYSRSIGIVDFAITGFSGTNRKPSLRPNNANPLLATSVQQYYERITQVGLEMQAVLESSILKLEGIRRKGALNSMFVEEDYSAYTIGGERTFNGVFDSDSDVSVYAEWLYDSRGKRSTEELQDDLFLAMRWGLNDTQDTEFVLAYVEDRRDDANATISAEFNRRLTDSLSLEAKYFDVSKVRPSIDVSKLPRIVPVSTVRKDRVFKVRVNYNF